LLEKLNLDKCTYINIHNIKAPEFGGFYIVGCKNWVYL
jgi:hypothetical protein